MQILRTLARFLGSEEGNVKRLQGVEPPLYRLRTQNNRVFFRDLGDSIEVTRVHARKDTYRCGPLVPPRAGMVPEKR